MSKEASINPEVRGTIFFFQLRILVFHLYSTLRIHHENSVKNTFPSFSKLDIIYITEQVH